LSGEDDLILAPGNREKRVAGVRSHAEARCGDAPRTLDMLILEVLDLEPMHGWR
jgi:hypothetical protein